MKNLPKAFSNINRVKILSCLSDQDKNVTDMITKCGLSQSAVSQHLKKLKDLGVIDCESDGRDRIYHLKYKEAGIISRKILKLISNK